MIPVGLKLCSEGGEVGPVWGSRPLGAPLVCACVGVSMHTALRPLRLRPWWLMYVCDRVPSSDVYLAMEHGFTWTLGSRNGHCVTLLCDK